MVTRGRGGVVKTRPSRARRRLAGAVAPRLPRRPLVRPRPAAATAVHAAGASPRGHGGLSDATAAPADQDLVLDFFRSNSDGNEPSPIHDPSHLHDAVIKGGPHDGQHVDLTGGWMDAGDMIKFAQNEAFSAAALEAAARLDPADAGAIGAQADVGDPLAREASPVPGRLRRPGRRPPRPRQRVQRPGARRLLEQARDRAALRLPLGLRRRRRHRRQGGDGARDRGRPRRAARGARSSPPRRSSGTRPGRRRTAPPRG